MCKLTYFFFYFFVLPNSSDLYRKGTPIQKKTTGITPHPVLVKVLYVHCEYKLLIYHVVQFQKFFVSALPCITLKNIKGTV